jgi:hypothetical protein
MAIFTHSALFLATVYKWQTTDKRVRNATTGTQFLLNTNRVDGIRALTNITSTCYYFDNPLNSKDNSHYMTNLHSVAQMVAHMDVVPTHTHMNLSLFPDGDHTKTPVTTVIPIDNFAWAVATTDAHSATQSLICYVENGHEIKRGRVNQSLAQLLALVQP